MMLSNRKLRMIIVIILLMIFCYFIGIYRPKALTTSEFTNNGTWIDTSIDSTRNNTSIRFQGTTGDKIIFSGLGEGYVLFTFQTSSYGSSLTSQLTEVVANSNNGIFTCEVGTTNGYLDSQMQVITWSAKCPLNLSGTNSLGSITFTRGGGSGKLDIRLGSVIAFVSKDSASNSSVIQADLSTIQQYQIDINNNISQFKNATHQDLEAIKNALANNNTAITNIQNNTQNINDSINDSSIDTNGTNTSVSGFGSTTNGSMSSTPVSNLIALPITFLTGVNNAISSSCTNVNYIQLFNYQLVLPCLNLSERLGNVWVIIDTIVSCMLLFSIGKSLVSTFARLSDMDTNIMYECYANGKDHRGESF